MSARISGGPVVAVMVLTGLLGPVSAQAGYAVLDGAPVTQGQLRIPRVELERIKSPESTPTDRFLLVETRVDSRISGVVARVRVQQVFENPYQQRLEALYVFPLPENAAVDGYSIEFGEQIIHGEVKRREEARQIYEAARSEGRKGALLEQERANIFSQSVANIPPGERVTVNIEYVQALDVDGDHYAFRFPMVVGPRYMPGEPTTTPNTGRGWARDTDQVTDASRISPKALPPGRRNGNDVFIRVQIDGGMPIHEVVGVTHEVETEMSGETLALVTLKNQSTIADKDFLLEYRLAGEQTVLASLAHRDGDQGYFALMLQPKWQIEERELAAREVILLLDVSGSMNGNGISQMRIFAQHLLDDLRPQDTFQVIAFSSGTKRLASSQLPATEQNIVAAKDFVRQLRTGGGTNLLPALNTALGQSTDEAERARFLFLLTDALVGNDHTILNYFRQPNVADVRVFPVAFGAAPNHYLISRAAEIGRGFAMQVTNQDNPTELAQRFNEKASAPYLTDVEIDWGTLQVTDVIPQRLPDLYAGKPLIVVGRYEQPATSEVTLRGNVLGQPVTLKLPFELPEQEAEHESLGTVWARQRIRQIWNENVGKATSQSIQEITRLGLEHQLVTRYTSFVAVEEKRSSQPVGDLRSEAVRVLTPEGMDNAVNGMPGNVERRNRQPAPRLTQTTPGSTSGTSAPPQFSQNSHTTQPSSVQPSSGSGRSSGGGGAVEWVFLAGLGVLAAGRRQCRRAQEHSPE